MTSGSRSLLTAILLFALLCPAVRADELICIRPGNPPDLGSRLDPGQVLAWHPQEAEHAIEAWNFHALFDSGHVLFGNLMVTNMGWGDNRNGSGLAICMPDGTTHHGAGDFPEEHLEASKSRFSIRSKDSHLSGDAQGFRVRASAGDLKANLEFKAMVPGFRWGPGVTYFGKKREDFLLLDFAYPCAKVTGTLQVKGQTIPVSGMGYMEHAVQTLLSNDFSRVWYMARGFGERYTLVFTGFESTSDYGNKPVYVLSVFDGDKPIYRTDRVKIRPKQQKQDAESGFSPPDVLQVDAHGYGGRLYGKLVSQRRVDSMSVLSSLSSFLRFVVETFVARPWVYRYVSDMSLTLELDDGSEPISILGPALMMVLYVDEE